MIRKIVLSLGVLVLTGGLGEGACGVFPLALTPNHNALHKDHFHLGAGVWPQCGY